MRQPLALAMLLLASTAATASVPDERRDERTATCPHCGGRPYRGGMRDWFCGVCAKVVDPRFV